MTETIAILDFGSQYTQVIARRIRQCNVYSRIYPYDTSVARLRKDGVRGIILSGGPSSVLSSNAPLPDKKVFTLDVPVLGICYGLQLMGQILGGRVEPSGLREYGRGVLTIRKKGLLLSGLGNGLRVWNSHGDKLLRLPKGSRLSRARKIPVLPSSRTLCGDFTDYNFILKFITPNVEWIYTAIFCLKSAGVRRTGRWRTTLIIPFEKYAGK